MFSESRFRKTRLIRRCMRRPLEFALVKVVNSSRHACRVCSQWIARVLHHNTARYFRRIAGSNPRSTFSSQRMSPTLARPVTGVCQHFSLRRSTLTIRVQPELSQNELPALLKRLYAVGLHPRSHRVLRLLILVIHSS
jgi:hypothetical protein